MNRWGFGGKKYTHQAGELLLTREGDVRFYPQVVVIAIVLVAVSFVTRTQPSAFYAIEGAGMVFLVWVVLSLLFLPRIVHVMSSLKAGPGATVAFPPIQHPSELRYTVSDVQANPIVISPKPVIPLVLIKPKSPASPSD
jgi:hypothetical protein